MYLCPPPIFLNFTDFGFAQLICFLDLGFTYQRNCFSILLFANFIVFVSFFYFAIIDVFLASRLHCLSH